MKASQIRIAGWVGVSLLILGQILPWGFRTRPLGAVWDSLFSRVSSPNLEWWIWFLAPVAAAVIAGKALYERRAVPKITIAPAVIFLGFWGLLILSGVRRYAKTTDLGPLATIVGLVVLGIVAFLKAPAPIRKPIAARR